MTQTKSRDQILSIFLSILLIGISNQVGAQETTSREKKNVLETTFFIVDHQRFVDPFVPEIGYGRKFSKYLLVGIFWKPDFYAKNGYRTTRFTGRMDISMAQILGNFTQEIKNWDIFPTINYEYRNRRAKFWGDPTDQFHNSTTTKIVFGAGLSHNLGEHWVLLARYRFTYERQLYFGVRYQF